MLKGVTKYIKGYRLQCILSPLFKLLEAVFELIVPLVIKKMIQDGIQGNDPLVIKNCILLLVVFAAVGIVCAICAQYFAAYAAAGISSDIRKDLFRKIMHLSVSDYEKIGSSNIVTGLTSDVNQIQSGINLTLRLLLRSPFIVFGAVIMAFTVSVRMALIFVVAVAVLGVFVAYNMRSAIPAYKATRKGLDALVDATGNGLSGVKVIRGFNRSSDDYKGFKEKSSALNVLQKKAASISALLNPVTFLIINLSVCILIARGAMHVDAGNLSQAAIGALYTYMSMIIVELIKLANLIVTVSRAVACAGRVKDLLSNVDESISDAVVVEDPHSAHSLEFRGVSFSYPDSSEETLTDVSFKVEKGERIGVIGMTGSGKSTVASLASGLYAPDKGEILLDGKPIEHISRSSLYQAMSLCVQKARMFTGSIKYNISLDREDITDEQVERAIVNSCTDEVISHKSEGSDFEVKANGAGLSGGQKQRIGIARALAGDPGLLIFDDSTSALDAATERKLLKNLSSLSSSPTMIFVSQKIKTVMDLDKILLIEDGKISAFAPHKELLNISENYRKLCALQNEEVAG